MAGRRESYNWLTKDTGYSHNRNQGIESLGIQKTKLKEKSGPKYKRVEEIRFSVNDFNRKYAIAAIYLVPMIDRELINRIVPNISFS